MTHKLFALLIIALYFIQLRGMPLLLIIPFEKDES